MQFECADVPQGTKDWWLVSDNSEIDLCLTDYVYMLISQLNVHLKLWLKSGETTTGLLRTSPLSKLGTLDTLPVLN